MAAAACLPCHLEAVQARHVYVQKNDVGRVLVERLQRGDAVGGLGHDLELRPQALEKLRELFPEEGFVFGEDSASGHGNRMIPFQSAFGAGQLLRATSAGARGALTTMYSASAFAASARSVPSTIATCRAASAAALTASATARAIILVVFMGVLLSAMAGSVGRGAQGNNVVATKRRFAGMSRPSGGRTPSGSAAPRRSSRRPMPVPARRRR